MTPTALSAELSDNISLMLAVSLTTMSVSSSGLSFFTCSYPGKKK